MMGGGHIGVFSRTCPKKTPGWLAVPGTLFNTPFGSKEVHSASSERGEQMLSGRGSNTTSTCKAELESLGAKVGHTDGGFYCYEGLMWPGYVFMHPDKCSGFVSASAFLPPPAFPLSFTWPHFPSVG